MDQQRHLALFARFPSPGKCKTRLIPRLGKEGASSFALAALTDLMHLFKKAACHKTLFYTPAAARWEVSAFLQHESLVSSWDIHPQPDAPDLGARLHDALEHLKRHTAIDAGAIVPVTFLGMDCFELTVATVQDSMDRVSSNPDTAHIIPARDGGYVLLTVPLHCDGHTAFVSEALPDVDEPGDLEGLWETRKQKREVYPSTFGCLETVMIVRQLQIAYEFCNTRG
ncbi:hypothetical protein EYZ11_007783 [Aspergillus tanneri]|uniref:Glycosyltransferase n=1 Tax=Aspergillus tanneri TaxID=1220188 RepID=A0A4S3JCH0_9EURO|nr:hypothetical protein EYZ11_007783 [Aspergillus tanneri]